MSFCCGSICMFAYMNLCLHQCVRMHVLVIVCMCYYVLTHVCMYACMYVHTHVDACMHACMYVGMYVCVYMPGACACRQVYIAQGDFYRQQYSSRWLHLPHRLPSPPLQLLSRVGPVAGLVPSLAETAWHCPCVGVKGCIAP